ncbi:MAG TPA: bifunctional proline dehydrogenase/L-glutamate gamma-semialdehyde dehydrogenase PutA [Alphaproteobacteria bacterium]|nr:bifunctional proline dehydrogenase/L-glutamate gamma-semialdehyde dehydrogenase PutA [Alphaproteobacteria bacterium]
MIFTADAPETDAGRAAIGALYRADETAAVERLLHEAALEPAAKARVARQARALVEAVRAAQPGQGGIDAFLHEYSLSSTEGIVLMCLAEALLRIPDAETADRLIRDKVGSADWERHLGQSDSLFVNASTWALMLTGRLLRAEEARAADLGATLRRLVARGSEPVVREAMLQAMRILGEEFVMGRTIEAALERASANEKRGYRHSYDMLGEAARTEADAERYYEAYDQAIAAIGRAAAGAGPIDGPGISVKLSALHPRFEFAQRGRVLDELVPRLTGLASFAKEQGIGLTVDAEEADRLDLTLDVFEAAAREPRLAGWDGLGLAVQAYQKRAPAVVDWLAELARGAGRRLMVRLVKGAYWDSEIKRAQERGLDFYPVYTRKASTDLSYIACAKRLLAAADAIYPQFATHNALTLATVLELAGARRDWEFQRLHGMGEALYEQIVAPGAEGRPCRIYAPVGSHEDLLPYLVRRLLENGANTSFVNRIVDETLPVETIVADPVETVAALAQKPHPRIPLPRDMYRPERVNSAGVDLSDPAALAGLRADMERAETRPWTAEATVGGTGAAKSRPVTDPARRDRVVGTVVEADPAQVEATLAAAARAAPGWIATPAEERAAALDRFADLLERERAALMALIVREAGRTVPDALSEVREAVDFARYYAARARAEFARPEALPGPTGESNELWLRGRGVFACISPWNFPLSIFAGQVTAALAAGNAAIAKPAEQTPLIAAEAVRLMHAAGLPEDVVQLLPGDGPTVGAPLVADPRVSGVVFTGSTETAWAINRALAARSGPIVPLIAETGGQNALLADSSALAEQVVADVLTSAFDSAGQRCSALRVLFVQDDIADKLIAMLTGAMDELRIGDPGLLATDVGPVIDRPALEALAAHAERMTREAKTLRVLDLPAECGSGTFFAPRAFELDDLKRLDREVFGPILHVVRFAADRLDRVIDSVNATGYGLTLGIHSRIDATVRHIRERVRAGNTYVNRNVIGAVVGVQPFGGEGLSGTGPKAGGPHYLHRFAVERTVTVNTTAAGGNAALMTLDEGD